MVVLNEINNSGGGGGEIFKFIMKSCVLMKGRNDWLV